VIYVTFYSVGEDGPITAICDYCKRIATPVAIHRIDTLLQLRSNVSCMLNNRFNRQLGCSETSKK